MAHSLREHEIQHVKFDDSHKTRHRSEINLRHKKSSSYLIPSLQEVHILLVALQINGTLATRIRLLLLKLTIVAIVRIG